VLDQLREDHALITELPGSLAAAVDALPAQPGPEAHHRFLSQLDGIGAIMESHFRFEERRIRAALDAWVDAPATAAVLFGVPSAAG
jgi:hypothetical protein